MASVSHWYAFLFCLDSHSNEACPVPARPCDQNGNFLNTDTPPPPLDQADWGQFGSREKFLLADVLFRKGKVSNSFMDSLLSVWAADAAKHNATAPFSDHREVLAKIDSISVGDTPWNVYEFRGIPEEEITPDTPSYLRKAHLVYYRDALTLVKNILRNTDFDGEFDYVPHIEHDEQGQRVFHDLMSGKWAWNKAVSCDLDIFGRLKLKRAN